MARQSTCPVFRLSRQVKAEIDQWVKKYPVGQQRSAVVIALLKAQRQNRGYLSEEVMDAVAEYLAIAPIEVYEIATFYDMLHLQPCGKHVIMVCTNVSCQLRGCNDVIDAFCRRLGIKLGETTTDERYTLKESECIAACDGAPMCQIDDERIYTDLTPDSVNQIIDDLDEEDGL